MKKHPSVFFHRYVRYDWDGFLNICFCMTVKEKSTSSIQVLMYIKMRGNGRSFLLIAVSVPIPRYNGEDWKNRAALMPDSEDYRASFHPSKYLSSHISLGNCSGFFTPFCSGHGAPSPGGERVPMCPLTLMEACIKTGCHGGGSHLWDATFSIALLGTSRSTFFLFFFFFLI